MEDELTSSLDGKTLGNLRVVDLKQELEKRGLSKSGSKKDLVKRLKQQLEFEKLCEERKSVGDCDLKKELDAATEQNEFVQRYLAQQQKIYAEQKEMKRLIELEESKKLEEKESCSSLQVEENSTDDNDTENEVSENENIDKTEKNNINNKNNFQDAEVARDDFKCSKDENKNEENNVSLKSSEEDQLQMTDKANKLNKNNVKNEACKDYVRNDSFENTSVEIKSAKECIIKCKSDENNDSVDMNVINLITVKIEETAKIDVEDSNNYEKENPKNISIENKFEETDTVLDIKAEENNINSEIILSEETDTVLDIKAEENNINTEIILSEETDTVLDIKAEENNINTEIILSEESNSVKNRTKESNVIVINKLDENKHEDVIVKKYESEKNYSDVKSPNTKKINNEMTKSVEAVSIDINLNANKSECSLISKKSEELLPLSVDLSKLAANQETYQDKADVGITDSSDITLMDKGISDMDSSTSLSSVPVSLSEIQLPQSPDDIVKTSNKMLSSKKDVIKKADENFESQNSSSDNETQRNGVPASKSSNKHSKGKLTSDNSCDAELNSKHVKDRKEESNSDTSKKDDLKKKELLGATPSDSEEKSNSEVECVKESHFSSSEKNTKSEESSSSEESSRSEEERRKSKHIELSRRKRRKRRSRSSSANRSSQSRESSPIKEFCHKKDTAYKQLSVSDTEKKNSVSVDKNSDKKLHYSVADKNVSNSNDPPRKKLKINRNNVVIAHSPTKDTVTSLEKNSPKEMQDPASPAEPEREMGEIIENIPEIKYEPRKLNFPGRKLSRKSSEDQSSEESKSKKSKWGRFGSVQKSSQTINISTDSLKNWFPDFKLVTDPVPVSESLHDDSPAVKDDKKLPFPSHPETDGDVKQTVGMNVAFESKDEPAPIVNTEEIGPVSRIIFIQNLVRPFTLLQLKELLRQTGNFIEEDFWIDKIKSKCFVTYETEEEAVKTRNALNGTRWPSSNPKILSVEFSSEDELELYRSGGDVSKVIPEPLSENKDTYESKAPQPSSDHRKRDLEKRKEKDRYKQQMPVREWDKDKVLQESPDRESFGKTSEGFKDSEKKDKKDVKKRSSEETPAKLLDDLFQKTKTAPCIYWLPLTEALISEREEARRLRRLEREKRIQQREQEDSEHRKRSRLDHKAREVENRSSTRSRSPTSRRR